MKLKQQIGLQFFIFIIFIISIPRKDFIDVLEISHANNLYIEKKNKMNKKIVLKMMANLEIFVLFKIFYL